MFALRTYFCFKPINISQLEGKANKKVEKHFEAGSVAHVIHVNSTGFIVQIL